MAKVIHEIMEKPLPDIIDEIKAMIRAAEQANREAEGHSLEAQAAAARAKDEAADAVKKQLGYLEPRITEAQDTAGKALNMAKEVQARVDSHDDALNSHSDAIKDLSGAVAKLRSDLNDLGVAVVNGLKGYGEYIMSHVDFLKIKN